MSWHLKQSNNEHNEHKQQVFGSAIQVTPKHAQIPAVHDPGHSKHLPKQSVLNAEEMQSHIFLKNSPIYF